MNSALQASSHMSYRIKEGWLTKKGHSFFPTVTRRLFVLKGEYLNYYAVENDAKAKGSIPLLGASVALESSTSGFVLSSSIAVYHLCAASAEERSAWVEALNFNIRISTAQSTEGVTSHLVPSNNAAASTLAVSGDALTARSDVVAAPSATGAGATAASPQETASVGGSLRNTDMGGRPAWNSMAYFHSASPRTACTSVWMTAGGAVMSVSPLAAAAVGGVAETRGQRMALMGVNNRGGSPSGASGSSSGAVSSLSISAGSGGVGSSAAAAAAVVPLPRDTFLQRSVDLDGTKKLSSPSSIRIWTGTWNMAEIEPPQESPNQLFPPGFDIYALSLQECMHTDAFLDSISARLGGGFLTVNHRIGATMTSLGFHGHISIAVWVSQWLVAGGVCTMSKAVRHTIPLGMNLFVARVGNKGAAAITLPIRLPDGDGALTVESALVFIACHLASDNKGKSKLPIRLSDAISVHDAMNLSIPESYIARAAQSIQVANIHFPDRGRRLGPDAGDASSPGGASGEGGSTASSYGSKLSAGGGSESARTNGSSGASSKSSNTAPVSPSPSVLRASGCYGYPMRYGVFSSPSFDSLSPSVVSRAATEGANSSSVPPPTIPSAAAVPSDSSSNSNNTAAAAAAKRPPPPPAPFFLVHQVEQPSPPPSPPLKKTLSALSLAVAASSAKLESSRALRAQRILIAKGGGGGGDAGNDISQQESSSHNTAAADSSLVVAITDANAPLSMPATSASTQRPPPPNNIGSRRRSGSFDAIGIVVGGAAVASNRLSTATGRKPPPPIKRRPNLPSDMNASGAHTSPPPPPPPPPSMARVPPTLSVDGIATATVTSTTTTTTVAGVVSAVSQNIVLSSPLPAMLVTPALGDNRQQRSSSFSEAHPTALSTTPLTGRSRVAPRGSTVAALLAPTLSIAYGNAASASPNGGSSSMGGGGLAPVSSVQNSGGLTLSIPSDEHIMDKYPSPPLPMPSSTGSGSSSARSKSPSFATANASFSIDGDGGSSGGSFSSSSSSSSSSVSSSSSSSSSSTPSSSQSSYVFLLGDLNFRLQMPFEATVRHISAAAAAVGARITRSGNLLGRDASRAPSYVNGEIAEEPWTPLLAHDELRLGLATGNIFPGFAEAPITFPPTYRLQKGTAGSTTRFLRSRGDFADSAKVRALYFNAVEEDAKHSSVEAPGDAAKSFHSPSFSGHQSFSSFDESSVLPSPSKSSSPSSHSHTRAPTSFSEQPSAASSTAAHGKAPKVRVPSYTDRILVRTPVLADTYVSTEDHRASVRKRYGGGAGGSKGSNATGGKQLSYSSSPGSSSSIHSLRNFFYESIRSELATAASSSEAGGVGSAAPTPPTHAIPSVDEESFFRSPSKFIPLPPLRCIAYDSVECLRGSDHAAVHGLWELPLLSASQVTFNLDANLFEASSIPPEDDDIAGLVGAIMSNGGGLEGAETTSTEESSRTSEASRFITFSPFPASMPSALEVFMNLPANAPHAADVAAAEIISAIASHTHVLADFVASTGADAVVETAVDHTVVKSPAADRPNLAVSSGVPSATKEDSQIPIVQSAGIPPLKPSQTERNSASASAHPSSAAASSSAQKSFSTSPPSVISTVGGSVSSSLTTSASLSTPVSGVAERTVSNKSTHKSLALRRGSAGEAQAPSLLPPGVHSKSAMVPPTVASLLAMGSNDIRNDKRMQAAKQAAAALPPPAIFLAVKQDNSAVQTRALIKNLAHQHYATAVNGLLQPSKALQKNVGPLGARKQAIPPPSSGYNEGGALQTLLLPSSRVPSITVDSLHPPAPKVPAWIGTALAIQQRRAGAVPPDSCFSSAATASVWRTAALLDDWRNRDKEGGGKEAPPALPHRDATLGRASAASPSSLLQSLPVELMKTAMMRCQQQSVTTQAVVSTAVVVK